MLQRARWRDETVPAAARRGPRRDEPPAIRDCRPAASAFQSEVLAGLRGEPKTLPCKWLYDERGSALFEAICELDEYYVTRTELGITRAHAAEMAAWLGPRCLLVEYGSGSGHKTRILLGALDDPVAYVPIDISRAALAASAAGLRAARPGLPVLPVCADYTADYVLPRPARRPRRTAVYFPGSTIGNFTPAQARRFLAHVAEACGPGGGLLIGVDLRKGRETLERAYDDAAGVTAAFNRNLLVRINRELGADFPVGRFRHVALWNADAGRVEMHLESEVAQEVRVAGERIRFAAGERIHTESSYKWRLEDFRALAAAAGWRLVRAWTDAEGLFSVQYLAAAPAAGGASLAG
jgi:dimethylhistidine N-methyltransferase